MVAEFESIDCNRYDMARCVRRTRVHVECGEGVCVQNARVTLSGYTCSAARIPKGTCIEAWTRMQLCPVLRGRAHLTHVPRNHVVVGIRANASGMIQ
jgi:hypothetical protein